jgi:hypothetical protein
MPRDDLLLGLFSCVVLSISLAWQAWIRQTPSEAPGAPDHIPRHPELTRLLPALLCGPLCSIGVLLLLPWAAAVASVQSGWVLGAILAGLVTVGAVYTLARRKTDS